MMLVETVISSISFQQVMLILLIIGMQLISLTTLIHGINMAYRTVNPDAGNLLSTPAERKEAADEARWNANRDRRERWSADRAERRREERRDRHEKDFVSSILDREKERRGD